MKNDLTCGVVRDLLPSYIEGLLGEESQQAVERHLAACPACTAALAAMREPGAEAEEQSHEVDFLKKVKKRNNRKVIAAAACTAIVLLGAFLLKLFVIGTPLQAQTVAVEAVEENNMLHLSVMSVVSANAFHGWKVETENGIASIYARDVLVSPLYSSGSANLDVPLEGVQEVWLGGKSGRLIWQDGVVISQLTLDLLDARAPSAEDTAALERIADLLYIRDQLGPYTVHEERILRTDGWTFEFPVRLNADQISQITCCNLLSLALVDDLEASLFSHLYPEDAPDPTRVVTAGMLLESTNQQALPSLVELYNTKNGTNWEPKASIKDYTRSPADFQRLLLILDSFYGTDLTTRGG